MGSADHLRREQAAERAVGQRCEMLQGVAFDDVEAVAAARFDHLVVDVDARL